MKKYIKPSSKMVPTNTKESIMLTGSIKIGSDGTGDLGPGPVDPDAKEGYIWDDSEW